MIQLLDAGRCQAWVVLLRASKGVVTGRWFGDNQEGGASAADSKQGVGKARDRGGPAPSIPGTLRLVIKLQREHAERKAASVSVAGRRRRPREAREGASTSLGRTARPRTRALPGLDLGLGLTPLTEKASRTE